ncbi:hypothetical protein CDAR_73461 [Caerostris darwini]|uniref:Glycosyltransferase family 92 protein n=1 Tax=Caerostris darwini TaxID=1538125 RepID=A0AAV4VLF9_9ARAC|nr:hypothetical protein CDAR_73461 [Caerostris darwini]
MSKGKFVKRVFCRIWFPGLKSFIVNAGVEELWVSAWDHAEPHEFYRPLLLSCPVTKAPAPVAVAVISEPCQEPSNVFLLNSTSDSKNFVICLKPLNFWHDISLKLLEWMELQFLLGADRIAVYKYHLHPRTLKMLQTYEIQRRVTIIEHTLPGLNPKNAQDLGEILTRDVWQKRRHEMLVYNDCFYKHIKSHKYVVNIDLDESIIPLKHQTWMTLLEYVRTQNSKILNSASVSVPNVYFFENFADESNASVPKYFNMLRHLRRSANFTPPGFAQKSFFPTQYALTVANHYALKALHPSIRTNTIINKNRAQMHHYRASCPPKMEKECHENYMKYQTRDPTLLRFKDKLIENVFLKIKELNISDLVTNDVL